MINKQDCLSLLVKLGDQGVAGVNKHIREVMMSRETPLSALQFLAQNQGFEATKFYEMLRKSHNQKKSPLYTNILKEDLLSDELITTLTSLLTQIALYERKIEDKIKFRQEIRAEEVSRVLHEYFNTGDNTSCQKLLQLIKADILVFEYLIGRRELA